MAGVEVCRTYLKPRSCRPEPPHHGATPILLVLEKREEIISSGSQTFWFRLIRTRQKQLVWLLSLFEDTDTTHCQQFFTWSINLSVHQLFQKALENKLFQKIS